MATRKRNPPAPFWCAGNAFHGGVPPSQAYNNSDHVVVKARSTDERQKNDTKEQLVSECAYAFSCLIDICIYVKFRLCFWYIKRVLIY